MVLVKTITATRMIAVRAAHTTTSNDKESDTKIINSHVYLYTVYVYVDTYIYIYVER